MRVYTILRNDVPIGRTRLERPCELSGDAQGVFEPAAAFTAMSARIIDQAMALKADLADQIATGEIDLPEHLVDDMVELSLIRADDAWRALRVAREDGSVVNARVNGFAQTSPGEWLIAVTINDADYWRRVAG